MKSVVLLGFSLLCITAVSGQTLPLDSIGVMPVQSLEVFSEGEWGSNAASKYLMAGLAFGGDVTFPVQSLSSRTAQKGFGFAGGTTRTGVKMTLPAMRLISEFEPKEWRTTVSVEHQQWASVGWPPGASRLLFGPLGSGAPEVSSLSGTSFDYISLTSLKIGGLRSFSSSSFGVPVVVNFGWSINAGEVHNWHSGTVRNGSEYTWNDEVMALDVRAQRAQSSGGGTHVGVDVGFTIEEANGGHGRPDSWSLSISDVGTAHFREFVFDEVDTAWSSPGLPLITGELPNFDSGGVRDTIMGAHRRSLPSTLAFGWERKAIRQPGVVWSIHAQKNTLAPRPQVECIRRSGREAVQVSIGLGYGGWGGTYIPLSFRMPSKAVRQGRPGGALRVNTRWLALAGTGGRMAFGLNWHQSF